MSTVERPGVAKFSLAEYEQMVRVGAFEVYDTRRRRRRLELLKGEIIEMSPVGFFHASVIAALTRWSCEVTTSAEVEVRIQTPIRLPLSSSELEPDVAWTQGSQHTREQRHPEPQEVALVIEVSDSSLSYDRTTKAELYASEGVTDYWIVNLIDEQVEVFRQPTPAGYTDKSIVQGDSSVAPLAFPLVSLNVRELFAVDG